MAQLAICGGSPVRTKPFTAWPIFSQDDEKALIDVLHSERWFMGDRKEAFEKAFAQPKRPSLALPSAAARPHSRLR